MTNFHRLPSYLHPTAIILLLVCRLYISNSQTNKYFPTEYPAYCSKHVKVTHRIEPLSEYDRDRVDELVQVHAIIRHGARTPWTALKCWRNYDVTWNHCNVTELMITTPSPRSNALSGPIDSTGSYESSSDTGFIFRKLYDGSRDQLGGDCLTGQLISEGYEQERDLGQLFYDFYLNNNDGTVETSRFNLFNSDFWNDIDHRQVYLRSDDEQRTLMSGQIVFSSMFKRGRASSGGESAGQMPPVVVDWHTGDYSLDQIHPNKLSCPKLSELSKTSFASKQWLTFNSSKEIIQLNKDLDRLFGKGYWTWSTIMDCLYTTVCTGRSVPFTIRTDKGNELVFDNNMFKKTIEYVEAEYFFNSYYNNSIYSRVAMSNLISKIKSYIDTAISAGESVSLPPLKFSLWAGHDTTIMPILAALSPQDVTDPSTGAIDFELVGSKTWPGYASFVNIEIYRLKKAGTAADSPRFGFRIVSNGKPILLPGCSSALCDIDSLMRAFSFVGDTTYSCSADASVPAPSSDDDVLGAKVVETDSSDSPATPLLQAADLRSINTTPVIVALVLSIFIGCLIGATFVVYNYKNLIKEGVIQVGGPGSKPGSGSASYTSLHNEDNEIEMMGM